MEYSERRHVVVHRDVQKCDVQSSWLEEGLEVDVQKGLRLRQIRQEATEDFDASEVSVQNLAPFLDERDFVALGV